MNSNLFSRELKNYAFSLLLWMMVITTLIVATMSVYPTFIKNQSKVMGMISLVPKGALEFKGISDVRDLASVLGFYAVNNVIYMMVLGSIFGIVLSSNILLKEEYLKNADYLLTRPVSRREVYFSKLMVILLYVFLLNLVASLAGFVAIHLVTREPFSSKAFLTLSVYTLLLNTLFSSLGIFLSTLVKRPKPITTLSIAVVLVFYFIFTLSKITESASKIGYLSPFKFVRTDISSPTYRLDAGHLLYYLGISLIFITLSYRVYRRKDIYT